MNTKVTFKNHLIMSCVVMALASMSQTAFAEEEPVAEYTLLDAIKDGKTADKFRLRYESVDQDAFQPAPNANKKLDTAHALTLRSLVGWQTAPFKNFSFGAQITDVHELNHSFNDRRENLSEVGKANYANIVDPSFTDVNQLFMDWTGIKNTKIRVGRQIVNLDNVRFIGDIAFRQDTQVFDGISVVNKSITDTEIFAAHFDQVRQVNTELRQGNIDIVNAKYRISPSESLVGYTYLVDVANLSQNGQSLAGPNAPSTAPSGGNGLGPPRPSESCKTDASSKTFGLRLDGAHVIDPTWKVLYTAEYAKQDDYAGGDKRIDAHYFGLGGGAMYNTFSIRVDHENSLATMVNMHSKLRLALITYSKVGQTISATPRQGIEDTFITVAGSIEKAKLYAEYHVFKSDEQYQSIGKLGNKYGTEFDASVMYPFTDKINGKIEYAKFSEDDVYGGLKSPARKGDKEIIWVTGMYCSVAKLSY